ncbi:MAG: response regulator [Polyangiales bacterium]
MNDTTNPEPVVLVVEDEPKIAKVLLDYLRANGFAAAHVDDGRAVAPYVRTHAVRLVLLDLLLPGMSGIEVCRELRKFTGVPIIMVTALVEEVDRLLGLEVGADDYVCKPFSPREVIARVKTVLRRVEGTPVGEATRGFAIDEAAMRISLDHERLDLTTSEFRLLRKLLLHPGRVFSRAQLLEELRGTDADAFDRAIDTHIKNLRKKLARVRSEENFIRSVYGVGYCFEREP